MQQVIALGSGATRAAHPSLFWAARCSITSIYRRPLCDAISSSVTQSSSFNEGSPSWRRRVSSRAIYNIPAAAGTREAQSAMSILAGVGDIYEGIAISPEHLPNDPDEFAERLRASLQEWTNSQRKGIWLKLPLSHAKLVPVAIAQDFVPHHAEREYIMLAKWLANSENKLPANPSHQVGVGAFVFDRQSQKVLMVQEKNGPLKGSGVWKMPTGLLYAREDIGAAAEREVLEETGVQASFKSVLAIRQAHTALWNKSDMFIVLALEPVAGRTDILLQEDELDGAEWQTLEQFESSPFQQKYPLLARIQERCAAYARGTYRGLDAVKFPHRQSEQLLVFGAEGSEDTAKL